MTSAKVSLGRENIHFQDKNLLSCLFSYRLLVRLSGTARLSCFLMKLPMKTGISNTLDKIKVLESPYLWRHLLLQTGRHKVANTSTHISVVTARYSKSLLTDMWHAFAISPGIWSIFIWHNNKCSLYLNMKRKNQFTTCGNKLLL